MRVLALLAGKQLDKILIQWGNTLLELILDITQ